LRQQDAGAKLFSALRQYPQLAIDQKIGIMSYLITPKNYTPLLGGNETEQGIKLIKDFFQENLSTGLRLRRVTGPLFVQRGLGLNDDLSGRERPVSFPIKDMEMRRPRWCTRWQNGKDSPWLNTRSSLATASIQT
jgi:hypothetical protein